MPCSTRNGTTTAMPRAQGRGALRGMGSAGPSVAVTLGFATQLRASTRESRRLVLRATHVHAVASRQEQSRTLLGPDCGRAWRAACRTMTSASAKPLLERGAASLRTACAATKDPCLLNGYYRMSIGSPTSIRPRRPSCAMPLCTGWPGRGRDQQSKAVEPQYDKHTRFACARCLRGGA